MAGEQVSPVTNWFQNIEAGVWEQMWNDSIVLQVKQSSFGDGAWHCRAVSLEASDYPDFGWYKFDNFTSLQDAQLAAYYLLWFNEAVQQRFELELLVQAEWSKQRHSPGIANYVGREVRRNTMGGDGIHFSIYRKLRELERGETK